MITLRKKPVKQAVENSERIEHATNPNTSTHSWVRVCRISPNFPEISSKRDNRRPGAHDEKITIAPEDCPLDLGRHIWASRSGGI